MNKYTLMIGFQIAFFLILVISTPINKYLSWVCVGIMWGINIGWLFGALKE
jgi:hypothetical protein